MLLFPTKCCRTLSLKKEAGAISNHLFIQLAHLNVTFAGSRTEFLNQGGEASLMASLNRKKFEDH